MAEGLSEGFSFSQFKVFRDEGKLSPEYVPSSLPHREAQLKELSSFFRVFLEAPGSFFVKVWLVGGVGTGKTATSKRLGYLLEREARRRGVDVRYVHVNCYKDRTFFVVAKRIAQRVLPSIPERGFSAQELLEMAWKALEDQDAYLVAALDEVDYMVKAVGEAPLYALSRVSDERLNVPQRLGLMLISRSHPSTYGLSESVSSSSAHNLVRFEPYTSSQLLDILEDRVPEAFVEGAVTKEALSLIADLAGVDGHGSGDARYALELLWRAGRLAEARRLRRIDPELVREVYAQTHPLLSREDLYQLTRHELLLLLSVARVLRRTCKAYGTTGEVEREYVDVCRAYSEAARRHTQVWLMIRRLKEAGYLHTKVTGGAGGRTTLIGLIDVQASLLEQRVEEVLKTGKGR